MFNICRTYGEQVEMENDDLLKRDNPWKGKSWMEKKVF